MTYEQAQVLVGDEPTWNLKLTVEELSSLPRKLISPKDSALLQAARLVLKRRSGKR